MRLLFVLLPCAALTACATPETRVRTALIDAGLPRNMAACMAQRMVDRLSLAQLQRLSRLSGVGTAKLGEMTMPEFLRRTRALQDPKIIEVVTSAGVGCAIAS